MIDIFLQFVSKFEIIIVILVLIIIYNVLLFFLRDKRYINAVNQYRDPEKIDMGSFTKFPLVNFIVPAWKEGELFQNCLESINNLSYPKIKVIVNAGGNEETLNIAQSFERNEKFVILHQKGGADRPSLGKIKAINECLKYVTKGIIYLMDADAFIEDEIFLRMVYPLIQGTEYVVVGGNKPLKKQQDKDLVKYLYMSRNLNFRYKFSRYHQLELAGGTNTTLKYEVIERIGEFSEDKIYATDISMGKDIIAKGFQIYRLTDFRARMYVEKADTIKAYVHQEIVWKENNLIYLFQHKKIKLFRFVLLFLFSLYIISFPFFIFINFGLFIIGLFIFIMVYLRKIRKFLVFRLTTDKRYYGKYNLTAYLKTIVYFYIEALVNVIIPFHLIKYLTKIKKKRK
jgi:cellulose synthase/poly-beta-1,6-N-acetylglucosamine synthase-like glycosyltransferase